MSERAEFNPAGGPMPEPWHTLWCDWLRFHTIPVPGEIVLIDWLERDEERRQIRYPTVVYDADGHIALLTSDRAAQRVAVMQLEAPPRPFPPLPPGAWVTDGEVPA